MPDEIDWQAISAKLRAPFDPADVDFRPQGNPNGNGKAQAVCYIDARAVADRLDDVVGPGAWSFTYEPLVIDKGQIQIAKGRLTIHGVTKEDVGEASNFDASKGCVSDALKRAAVLWGIGRYLYDVGGEWVTLDQYKRISREDVQRLRGKLPTPNGKTPPHRTPQPHTAAQPQHAPASTSGDSQPPQRVGTQDTPAVDPLALTHASAQDQRKLVTALRDKGYTNHGAVAALLLHVTGRAIPAADLLAEKSDITLHDINRVNEFLSRPAGNANGQHGKAAS